MQDTTTMWTVWRFKQLCCWFRGVGLFYTIFRWRNRYDVIYDVIYANELCNAGISRHYGGNSLVLFVLNEKVPPWNPRATHVSFFSIPSV